MGTLRQRAFDYFDRSTFSISRKILAIILIIGSIVTTVTTAVQLSFDYFQDVSSIRNNLGLIEKSYTPGVTSAVWAMDVSQLQTQLEGIISIPGISYVQFTDDKKKVIAKAGIQISSQSISKSYSLSYDNRGHSVYLGNLTVSATLDEVYTKILNKALVIFLIQLAKTLLVSTLIYLAIKRVLTRHLIHISQYLQRLNVGSSERVLELQRPKASKYHDELEVLVLSINHMRSKVEKSYSELNALNEQLEEKVQQKTQLILEQRQKLEYVSKMSAIGEMAGGMAHEINTPLSTAQLHAHMLLTKADRNSLTVDFLKSALGSITKTLDRIAAVIHGLRQFSKPTTSEPMRSVRIQELVEQSMSLCQEKISSLGIQMTIEGPDVEVFCRPADFSQVIVCLILNARDAIANSPEKWIRIEWAAEFDQIFFAVTDSGPGIPSDIREKIFQPFFTTKAVNAGTGLGLSIAKGLIENQGGELSLDSQSDRTRFVIRVQVAYALKAAA